jgi:hypothetical protein
MLKQKLPFLYEYFDQLIFYDLNARTKQYSTDGSHEYIASYPDPAFKIRLMSSKRAEGKLGMFNFGCRHVRNDMDVFWCTDMDEFFYPSLIQRVERAMENEEANSILVRHVVFFKNERWVLSTRHHHTRWWFPYARIARHTPGNIYRHCELTAQYRPVLKLDEDLVRDTIYHFAEVGDARMQFRCSIHKSWRWYEKVWKRFDESAARKAVKADGQYGYPDMHEAGTFGVTLSDHQLPAYLDAQQMVRELDEQRTVPSMIGAKKRWKMENVVSPPDFQLQGGYEVTE